MRDIEAHVIKGLDEAELKAWDSLSRYKFQMFGYWAAIWVHLNRISGEKRPNPWAGLVSAARMARKPADSVSSLSPKELEQNEEVEA